MYRTALCTSIRSLVSHVEIECYDVLYEKSRTFARLFATYEDGSQEYVQAANWSASWPGQDEEDYEQIKQKIVDEYVQPIEALLQKIKEEVIDRDNIWN